MQFIDASFRERKGRYLFQCVLGTIAVLVVLIALNTVRQTAIIASLGASSFIAFTMPHARLSKARVLVGGYLVGTMAGCLCWYLHTRPFWGLLQIPPASVQVVAGALAVGLAILLMVVMNAEHPPAAGLALAFVLNAWDGHTVIVVLVGITSLVALKTILQPVLVDLL
jgi:CBS-domain-containing membrane protein